MDRERERIAIEIADGGLSAEMTLNLSADELDMKNRDSLIREIIIKLRENGIVHGIKKDLLSGELESGKSFRIAEGTPPINGRDSITTMYQIKEAKPLVHEDGTVDFYDLKLINRVKPGDWLGERADATDGIPGRTVKGEQIKAINGKNYPMLYDKNTVMEMRQNDKTVLYSRISGAVNYTDGIIRVSNHLEIEGDVNFSTGNVKFDGFVTIKGTVADGFSVVATRDIEINSDLGIGNVKEIVSSDGSVYIKGGVASKGQTEIKAFRNIYVKYLENANVESGGTLHIGYYSINSNISAKEIIMDSIKGQIIGGNTRAEVRIAVPIVGSESEKRTFVEVTGFDRELLRLDLDNTFHRISDLKNEQQKLKLVISEFEKMGDMSPFQRKDYNDAVDRMYAMKQEIKDLEERRKSIAEYLKARGEGEISIAKKVYTNVTLVIKKTVVDISPDISAATYYFQDGQIKQLN